VGFLMKKHYRSLSPYLPWLDVKRPIDWPLVFGRSAPLEVEIGFGSGEFLAKRAKEYPERDFIGIERMWSSVRRALAQIDLAGLKNVRLLLGDTRVAFDRLFQPQSVHQVYSLFPMPWPKHRHTHHRVFSRQFFRMLNNRLVEGGEVQVVTDYEPYLEWMRTQSADAGFAVSIRETPPLFGTKYELKWKNEGKETFHELRLVKQAHQDGLVKEDIYLKTHWANEFDPERFNPANCREEVVVEFKDFLYDPARRRAMARVMVVEDTLIQHFWIEIGQEKGKWHIHLAKGFAAVPTVGVQRALDLASEAVSRSTGQSA
jgi:tRNA (guanine-N7-)-methyltransferase